MKKAWRIKGCYGSTYLVLLAENGKELDVYKESTWSGLIASRAFSFMEYSQGVPQKIAERLNRELKNHGCFTEFIENV